MTHFRLDVDPYAVARAAAAATHAEQELQSQAAAVDALLPTLRQAWQGQAADVLSAEIEGLCRQAFAAAPRFDAARRALQVLTERYACALEVDVPRLNAQWQQAHDDYDRLLARRQREQADATAAFARVLAAGTAWAGRPLTGPALLPVSAATLEHSTQVLQSELRALTARFEDLREDLHAATRQAAGSLAEATVVPVPTHVVAAYLGGGWQRGALGVPGWGGLGDLPAGLPLSALQRAVRGQLPAGSGELLALLTTARSSGLPPRSYAAVLRAYLVARALDRAGIDPSTWRPDRGVDGNREAVLKVYAYYGTVYELDPALEWAGLANLVGPGFTAGFLDLDQLRDLARGVGQLGPALPALARATDEELRFFETTFLRMQRDIFLDLGAMHEAYLAGAPGTPEGLANLQEMADAGLVGPRVMTAWRDIDQGRRTGSAELLHRGAIGLADREQNDIIAGDWDAMRRHPPMGAAVTYLMTVIGKPSVPGARYPGQVRPLDLDVTYDLPLPDEVDLPNLPDLPVVSLYDVEVDLPDLPDLPTVRLPPDHLELRTPLPAFDISRRGDRWQYFLADTMPAFTRLLAERNRPTITTQLARPLPGRIAEQRLRRRIASILRQLHPGRWHPVLD